MKHGRKPFRMPVRTTMFGVSRIRYVEAFPTCSEFIVAHIGVEDEGTWTLTHKPSGTAMLFGIGSYTRARYLAGALSGLLVPWYSDEADDVRRAIAQHAEEIRRWLHELRSEFAQLRRVEAGD